MLKISIVEFFVRLIPEVLLFMMASYTFSKTVINKGRYILSSVLFGLSSLMIRFLPINYGVHTIVVIIALTIITSLINKIDIIKSIKASIITAITLFICEGINIMLLISIFGTDLDPIMKNTLLKTIYSLPSLICFAVIVIVFYKSFKKKGKLQNV